MVPVFIRHHACDLLSLQVCVCMRQSVNEYMLILVYAFYIERALAIQGAVDSFELGTKILFRLDLLV